MGIKTNELQSITAVKGTDSIVADTGTYGTARVPFNLGQETDKRVSSSPDD